MKEFYCSKCEEDVECQEESYPVTGHPEIEEKGYFCPFCGKELTDQAFSEDCGDYDREICAENELTKKQEDDMLEAGQEDYYDRRG